MTLKFQLKFIECCDLEVLFCVLYFMHVLCINNFKYKILISTILIKNI